MTGRNGNQHEPLIVCEEVSDQWQFLHRVGQMPLVEQAINTTAESYQRVKSATPSMMQPTITSMEKTTVRIVERIITTIQALPLPLKCADKIACNGLDTFERLMVYKYWILKRLRTFISKDSSVSTDEEYLSKLLEFANETKNLAVGEIRNLLEAFLDTQIGLFENIEEAVESYYRIHKKEKESVENLPQPVNGAEFSDDLVAEVFMVKVTFDEVMKKRNLLEWLDGRPNPLEPMWKYLQALIETLTAEEVVMRRFSEKIYFIKIVLQSAIEQVKLAAADPGNFSLEEAKNTMIDQLTGLALAWLPEYALQGLSRITGYQLPGRKSPSTSTENGRTEGKAATNGASRAATNGSSPKSVTIKVQCETPREGQQQAAVSEQRAHNGESNGLLEVAEDNGVETGDSSDQNSLSGLEHSSELEVLNGEEPKNTSRSTRRRRKKSGN